MVKETTYNKYKRQNIIMKTILSADVKVFLLEAEDWKERSDYLNKCIIVYRQRKMEDVLRGKHE